MFSKWDTANLNKPFDEITVCKYLAKIPKI